MRRIAGILLGCMCIVLHAAGARAFSDATLLLTNPANARAIAMGDVGVTDNSDPSTIFYNPANVIAASRLYALAAQQRFEENDNIWLRRANAGFSWHTKGSPLSVGTDLSYGRLNLGETVMIDTSGTILGTFNAYQDVVALATGMGITLGSCEFRLGVGVKRWVAAYGPSDLSGEPSVGANATTFDAGAAFVFHTRHGAWNITPAFGAAMMDAGQDIDWGMVKDPLPTRLNFGASVRVDSSPTNVFAAKVPLVSIVCQADGIDPTEGDFEWGIGEEIAVAQILFLRTGVHRYASTTNGNEPTEASWGAGLGFPAGPLRARFDYGRQQNSYEKDHMDVLLELSF